MKVNGRPRSFGPARFSLTMTLKCLKITWFSVYRFDSSSVVIMPFLKAPVFNDYKLADNNSHIILKPVLSTF